MTKRRTTELQPMSKKAFSTLFNFSAFWGHHYELHSAAKGQAANGKPLSEKKPNPKRFHQLNVHVLSKTTGVVVAIGFSVAEGFQDRIALDQDVFNPGMVRG